MPSGNDAVAALQRAAAWLGREAESAAGNWLGRFVLLRVLGLVYLMAFLTLYFQGPALIGPNGLEPAAPRSGRPGRRARRSCACRWCRPRRR